MQSIPKFLNKPLNCLITSLILILSVSQLSLAAPSKQLWPEWQTNNPASTLVINHGAYQDFLSKYVQTNASGVNLVPYAAVTQSDQQKLASYISYLASIDISQYNSKEQLAFWVNLYNALTIQLILDQYPVASIRDIKSGTFSWLGLGSGPWDKPLITINNQQLTLNNIEHNIIRPIWHNPLTHYALNCASYSCPNLQKTAYTGDKIDQLLQQAASEYINNSRAVAFMNKNLRLSSIYQWYQEDFGANQQAVLKHLMRYAKPSLKEQLAEFNGKISYHYNWLLNSNG